MPSRRIRSKSDLVVFSSDDPGQVINWLCNRFGLQSVLAAVSQYRPDSEAPSKRASKKGGKRRGRPRGSRKGSKGAAKRSGGGEIGNN